MSFLYMFDPTFPDLFEISFCSEQDPDQISSELHK